jgi:hypothetical protein
MPANRLFRSQKIEGEKEFKGVTFRYLLYLNPSYLAKEDKQYIVDNFGDRMVKGQVCLDITKANTKRNLKNKEYSAIAFVKNANMPEGSKDEGSGARQFYDWCDNGDPQLWVNDLCRVNEFLPDQPKPAVSPIEFLFSLFEEYAKTKNLQNLHLMVDEDKRAILVPIYEKYGFGITTHCEYNDSIIMTRPIPQIGGKRKTRKNRTRRA